jgi:hypothetical protein
MQKIRHDRPGLESVGLAVTFAQLLLDERRKVGLAKPALAPAAIKPRLELEAAL